MNLRLARRAWPVGLTIVLAFIVMGLVGMGRAKPVAAQSDTEATVDGADLYATSCVTCHGSDGTGTDKAPSLLKEGPASVDFVLRTGRMPPGDIGSEAHRRPLRYTEEEITALVDYVGAMGDGPEVPQVNLDGADPVNGGDLYRRNCSACHQAGGAGAALSQGRFAPSLDVVQPTQVVEATIIGPGAMPSFPRLSDQQRSDIAAYVHTLQTEGNAGGASLGRVGPVGEGLVAWLAIGVLVGITTLIGRRRLE